jgi:RND family efflux transporter MFP subunit
LATLRASEIASRAASEEAEYAERSAEASLREARVQRDEARQSLARTRIRAPFAGRVSERFVDPGQFVTRGTVLARLHSTAAAEVRLPVSLSALADLGLGLAGGEIADGPSAELEARLGERSVSWPARVVRVEGEVSARSRMVHVVVRVDEPFAAGRPALAPGLFVEAVLKGRKVRDAVILPRDALRPPDQVWVIDAQNRARSRRVEVLRADADQVFIVGGLVEGERVCSRTHGVLEGLALRPVEWLDGESS